VAVSSLLREELVCGSSERGNGPTNTEHAQAARDLAPGDRLASLPLPAAWSGTDAEVNADAELASVCGAGSARGTDAKHAAASASQSAGPPPSLLPLTRTQHIAADLEARLEATNKNQAARIVMACDAELVSAARQAAWQRLGFFELKSAGATDAAPKPKVAASFGSAPTESFGAQASAGAIARKPAIRSDRVCACGAEAGCCVS
jgi:hypothetical protein